jgi:hypothetical protein
MDRAAILSCFNRKLEEFVQDLTTVFPDDADFVLARQSLRLLRNVDDRKPRAVFDGWVQPYKQRILERDDNFFLSDGFAHGVVDRNVKDPTKAEASRSFASDLVQRIRKYWGTLSPENRDVVWKYLDLLVKLNERCGSSVVV